MSLRTLLALGLSVALAGTAAQAQETKQLVIGTGGTGGVYYPLGGGIANVIGQAIPGYAATAQVTGASIDNIKLLGAGKADVGFSQVDAAWDAVQGKGKFSSPQAIKALSVLYPNHMHVVTIESTGIKSVADLKGKRVSVGSTGSATEVFSVRVLEAVGIDADKDITKERLGVAESVNAIKDGKIDAFMWVGGLPTAAVTDLAATPNTKIKFLDVADLAEKMNAKYGPLYTKAVIPKATYTGMDADSQNLTVWNLLVVADSMPEDLAYKLAKVMFDKQDDLIKVHREAANIKLENQVVAKSGIPFHKGALKFLAEKGVKAE